MRKNKKVLIIIFSVLCISIVAIAIYFKISTIEIPDNPNLKISIDYRSVPSSIITYYFYDDTIIETSYSGGVLSTGPVSSTSTTKYYFNEKINLSELRNFIDKMPRDTSGRNLVEITEKDGTPYGIDTAPVELLDGTPYGIDTAPVELLDGTPYGIDTAPVELLDGTPYGIDTAPVELLIETEIMKITDNAIRKQER